MQSVELPLRTAIMSKTSNLIYATKVIPVYEEYANPTPLRPIALINIGNIEVQAYIVLLNQTSNDMSAKCRKTDATSIQAQVTTVWPKGSGGSKTAEEIGNVFLSALFPVSDLSSGLDLATGFDLWKSIKTGSRNIPYQTETSNVWVHQIMLECWISQD